jgi:hypothetical protein
LKIISQILLVIASALLIAVVTFGTLSLKDVGPPVPLEVAPPVLQVDALVAALTTPASVDDAQAHVVTSTAQIPAHSLEEIPAIVAARFVRFVAEASDNKESLDLDASANYLRTALEAIPDAEYRRVFFEGLLMTSHEVLANESVVATARRSSAAKLINQFYDEYERQFHAGLQLEAGRLDALIEQREQRETQATQYRVFATLCLAALLFFGSAWLIVRNTLRKRSVAVITSALGEAKKTAIN